MNESPEKRKELLKHMILQLHEGEAPDQVRKQLVSLLQKIPYNEVVEVEQQLINEGLPEEEVLKFCDIHTMVLEGNIDLEGAKLVPEGHPVDTFKKENKEIIKVINNLEKQYASVVSLEEDNLESFIIQLKGMYNNLSDVEKHYLRKENLLFPYLEKANITGPPKVMWGKHDEIRELLSAARDGLNVPGSVSRDELQQLVNLVLKPASDAVADMVYKEEEILLPMSLDTLNDFDWYDILKQEPDFGYCLYDPIQDWEPEGADKLSIPASHGDKIRLPSGNLNIEQLTWIFNTLPGEVTFIDEKDKVRYFSQNKHQIFARSRAVIGRDVRLCHPPKSVHMVEQILADFKTGKQNSAEFWFRMQDMFVHVEYFAVRNKEGNYLGTMEFVQDIAHLHSLEGEQRLLNYKS